MEKPCEDPLKWWKGHKAQFPIGGYKWLVRFLVLWEVRLKSKMDWDSNRVLQMLIWNLKLKYICVNFQNLWFGCETFVAKSLENFRELVGDLLKQMENIEDHLNDYMLNLII